MKKFSKILKLNNYVLYCSIKMLIELFWEILRKRGTPLTPS